MNAQPVDVLARIAAVWGEGSQEYAAVAELVEAGQFARETGGMGLGYTPGVDRRLAAALARVQGGAA